MNEIRLQFVHSLLCSMAPPGIINRIYASVENSAVKDAPAQWDPLNSLVLISRPDSIES